MGALYEDGLADGTVGRNITLTLTLTLTVQLSSEVPGRLNKEWQEDFIVI
jgi:hypothetical protein